MWPCEGAWRKILRSPAPVDTMVICRHLVCGRCRVEGRGISVCPCCSAEAIEMGLGEERSIAWQGVCCWCNEGVVWPRVFACRRIPGAPSPKCLSVCCFPCVARVAKDFEAGGGELLSSGQPKVKMCTPGCSPCWAALEARRQAQDRAAPWEEQVAVGEVARLEKVTAGCMKIVLAIKK